MPGTAPPAPRFDSVLIANRGEIARRIIRTARRMGLRTIAVYSEADRAAPHVREADEAHLLGPSAPESSYLDIDRIVEVALAAGAGAIHPGYGFISESAAFARAIEEAGMVFVGPTWQQIEAFGPKHTARAIAMECQVPCVPGSGLVGSEDAAAQAAAEVGYPVMVKASGGGGGVGIVTCADEAQLRAAFASVTRLAAAHFATPGVFVERFIARARHLEVQVFGDGAGNVAILGDRDCSLQRRHQKVVEEAPAPHLPDHVRETMHRSAAALARHVDYRSAGTVEFVYDAESQEVFFLEMNTRLQVEHPVTEQILGVDLVEWMLRVGLGDVGPAGFLLAADLPRPTRHSVEARIYAEDPSKDHRPSSGLLTEVAFPAGAVADLADLRIESGVETGDVVTPVYDPMLAKLIVTADDRTQAFAALADALAETRIQGLETNLGLLVSIARSPEVLDGSMTTSLLETLRDERPRIDVERGGASTTIQDWPGRLGHWQVGVPPGGPMDDRSFRLANRAVGNPEGAPGLECTVTGPALRFSDATLVCVTGADAVVTVDGIPVPQWEPVLVPAGGTLDVGTVRGVGVRTYVAARAGFDVPAYLGSAATFAPGSFGGHGGRALATGDVLRTAPLERAGSTTQLGEPAPVPAAERPVIGASWTLHVAEGPQPAPDYFTPEDITAIYDAEWEVHFHAARTGIRLVGPKPRWARPDGGEAGLHPSNLHDNAYSVGAINFTGDTPSILGPDGPSLGGFACPVTVVSADRWKLGQLRPGDTLRLVPVNESELPRIGDARRTARAFVPRSTRRDDDDGVLARRPATDAAPEVVYRRGGDDNLLVEYGPMTLDLGLRMRIHALMEALARVDPAGLVDVTPGVRSLHLHVDPAVLGVRRLLGLLQELEDMIPATADLVVPSREVHLPLSWDDPAVHEAIDRYASLIRDDAPWNPSNIEFIRRANGLGSVDEVRDIVMSAQYMVLGLGDVYLGAPAAAPLDPRHRLMTTKYNPARTWTAEGTVGIGGTYMCVYGMDSPGGYQLVGRTLPIWAGVRTRRRAFTGGDPWLLRFFDRIRYHPVSAEELTHLRSEMAADRLELDIRPGEFSLREHEDMLTRDADPIAAFRARQATAFEAERAAWEAAGEFATREEAVGAGAAEDDVRSRLPEGATVVEAPMAGAVWKVEVPTGASAAAGAALLVLEAMKMETPVRAPHDLRVVEMLVEAGATVAAGQPLAIVSAPAPLTAAAAPPHPERRDPA
ncbi:urea carboxylase [Clavibacter nebraskensis]|uniref:Urea carboxylase n=3 Tax=Clavibacter nebraskensis TaxID=31963 RepID=A0AAI8ZJR7_9MICO|nr:urea carboxylase [Clavibacter nebraskensis]KXU19979.1 urea carboxylase [Clavibacter nebraskensis]OAH17936.1 urea carboxylase [Clavibacter nebraskensis]QGV70249.1 urea carboxylase [Clavibacter nebraskensis]QGV73040.1 urea carboxylase [Clavibacter nebraskensis]UQB04520.1 urea carboxylase [Clavibacter nebraskensis]